MSKRITDPKYADEIVHDILMAAAKIDERFYVAPIYRGKSKRAYWLVKKIDYFKYKLCMWRKRKEVK